MSVTGSPSSGRSFERHPAPEHVRTWACRPLLDHCYAVGGKIPDDRKALYRVCKASTPRERRIVDKILSEMFLHESGLTAGLRGSDAFGIGGVAISVRMPAVKCLRSTVLRNDGVRVFMLFQVSCCWVAGGRVELRSRQRADII